MAEPDQIYKNGCLASHALQENIFTETYCLFTAAKRPKTGYNQLIADS